MRRIENYAVQWAVDALSDGHDVPSIRILAGLDLDGWPDAFEADTLVEKALRELGIPETDPHSHTMAYLRELATAIVAGKIAPQEGANLIHRRVISPLDHPADLQAWCYLWEGNAADCSRSLEDSEIDQAIVDYATIFLRRPPNPPLRRAGLRPAAERHLMMVRLRAMNRCVVQKRVVALASLIVASGLAAPVYSKQPRGSHARQAVNQIVPLSDGESHHRQRLLRSLFKTTDAGKHWRKLREGALRLAVSDGKTLWSFVVGWPGVHEAPVAELWRSDDSGETWR